MDNNSDVVGDPPFPFFYLFRVAYFGFSSKTKPLAMPLLI